jgi:hypothetical protein
MEDMKNLEEIREMESQIIKLENQRKITNANENYRRRKK